MTMELPEPSRGVVSPPAYGLLAVMALSTFGEGGGAPTSLLVWHAALAFVMALVLAFRRRPGLLPGTAAAPPLAAFSLFLVVFAVGVARAPFTYGALLVAIELACFFGIVLLAATTGPRLFETLLWPVRLGAAGHGLLVLVQWVRLDSGRPAGTFLNPNHLGLWLAATLLFSLGHPAATKRGRVLVAATALPALAALLVSRSKGALIAFIAGAVVLGLLSAGRWLRLDRRQRRTSAALVALALVLVVAVGGVLQRQRSQEFDPFRWHRFKIWSATVEAVLADPWWGTGPGQFAAASANLSFADGEAPMRFDRTFSMSHSDVLRPLAELGVPATLALLAAVGLALRCVMRRRGQGALQPGADGAIAALAAVAVQGVVDNPSSWASIYVLAAILLGGLISEPRRAPVESALATRVLAAALVIGALGVLDVAPYLAWSRIRGLPPGRLDPPRAERLERAVRLNPLHPDYRMRLAEHVAGDGSDWTVEGYADAREYAEHAVRLQPRDAAYRTRLARIEALACLTLFHDEATRDRAAEHFEAAETLARHDPFIPLALAKFLTDTGDLTGARRAAERALELEPEAALPRLVLADVLAATGRLEETARAAALLLEARDKVAQWSDRNDSSYVRRLLVLDPRAVDRVERKIVETRTTSAVRP